jgi:mono/diheme cytochrome c family protein
LGKRRFIVKTTHLYLIPERTRIGFLFLPVFAAALLVATAGWAQEKTVKKVPIAQSNSTSGKQMFGDYCAPCHGLSGKGDGPAASALKTPPADLTLLAQKNGGKFPMDHVMYVLRKGTSSASHGSSDMPVWGSLFKSLNPSAAEIVDQRILNLSRYIESLQAK